MNRETAMMLSRRIKVLFILAIVTAVTSTLGGNLLVSLVTAAVLTAGFIAGDRVRLKNKKYKDKVEELLKNNE